MSLELSFHGCIQGISSRGQKGHSAEGPGRKVTWPNHPWTGRALDLLGCRKPAQPSPSPRTLPGAASRSEGRMSSSESVSLTSTWPASDTSLRCAGSVARRRLARLTATAWRRPGLSASASHLLRQTQRSTWRQLGPPLVGGVVDAERPLQLLPPPPLPPPAPFLFGFPPPPSYQRPLRLQGFSYQKW